MNTLVEIQPRELKFIFEVKKQSSCSVHLANVTDQYIAFKVKTTSPKKYCVRPNVGIIKPMSAYDFTVTMQAQKSLSSDMVCKDKFLIQSTVVPFGTTEDDITPDMFMKNSEKYMEETKLRVVLTSAPNSPEMTQSPGVLKQEESEEGFMLKKPHSPVVDEIAKQEPLNEPSIARSPKFLKQEASSEPPSITPSPRVLKQETSFGMPLIVLSPKVSKQEASYEDLTPKERHSPDLLPVNGVPEKELSYVNLRPMHKLEHGVENSSVTDVLMKKEVHIQNIRKMEESIPPKIMEKFKPPVQVNDQEPKQVKETEGVMPAVPVIDQKAKQMNEMEDIKLKLLKDIEELKTKISSMDIKLEEAKHTIVKLTEEKSSSVHDMEALKQELGMVRRRGGSRKAHVGFPPLFVCMVSLISLVIGFLFRS